MRANREQGEHGDENASSCSGPNGERLADLRLMADSGMSIIPGSTVLDLIDLYEDAASERDALAKRVKSLAEENARWSALVESATKALQEDGRLRAENERLAVKVDGYRAALWLCTDNVGGFLHPDGSPFVGVPNSDTMFASVYAQCEEGKEPRLSILCSDTFAYACADAEDVAYPQAAEVLAIARDQGWPGVIRWIEAQRQARGEEAQPLANVSRSMSDLDRITEERNAAQDRVRELERELGLFRISHMRACDRRDVATARAEKAEADIVFYREFAETARVKARDEGRRASAASERANQAEDRARELEEAAGVDAERISDLATELEMHALDEHLTGPITTPTQGVDVLAPPEGK